MLVTEDCAISNAVTVLVGRGGNKMIVADAKRLLQGFSLR